MFYCEECRKKNNWQRGIMGRPTSYGPCEVCKTVGGCYDIPSGALGG